MTNVTLVPPMAVNPLSNGAVGDGTTDDSTALTNTLALLSTSTGGNLYIPYGYTFLTSGLNISSFSGYLNFFGNGTLKLKNGANQYIIYSTSGSMTEMHISGVRFDCNSLNQTGASGGIHIYKARRCIIDSCEILNPWQAGIYLEGAGGDFGYQNRICNNWIYGGSLTTSGTNAYGEGLRLVNTDENSVYGNHFEANGNPNDGVYGVHVYDQNGLTDYSGNSFVNGMGVFKLDGLQCIIRGNRFDGNAQAAVQINGSANETVIIGNQIFGVGYVASGGSANSVNAIYVNAPRCVISGNTFGTDGSATPKTRSFVNIDSGGTDLVVKDNEFSVGAAAGTLAGVITFVGSQPARVRISDNVGYDNVNSRQSYTTENHGTATVANGTTSIVVTHGLSITPTLEQITVTPQKTLNSAHFFWVDTVTSTQFTIHTDVNPGAGVDFGWIAKVGW